VSGSRAQSTPEPQTAEFATVLPAIAPGARLDVQGLPLGALSLLLTEAARRDDRRFLVLAKNSEQAAALEANLAFFAGAEQVLAYPATETSPFVEVAPDRRAEMDRLSVLDRLRRERPFRFLVAPIGALLRRVIPPRALARRSLRIEVAEPLERRALIDLLAEGGYLRVPLVEDPGSFAVRGALLDIFPAGEASPVRIELDDDLVASIRRFDPDDQRSGEEVEATQLHPAREILLGPEELSRARDRIGDLCDDLSMPTSKRRALVEDLTSGRSFLGIEALLPAFHEALATLFDYLPPEVGCVAVDPPALEAALFTDLQRAAADREARLERKAPTFALDRLYLGREELDDALGSRSRLLCHRLPFLGEQADDERPELAALSTPEGDRLLRIDASYHLTLENELKAERGKARADRPKEPLLPLVRHCKSRLELGGRVLLCLRTRVQAERLATLLRGRELKISEPKAFDAALLGAPPPGRPEVVYGTLASGFELAARRLCFISEDEIFGAPTRRRRSRTRKGRDTSAAFIADLRELSVGDHVVHIDHGVGVYRGLARQELPVSRYEELQGMRPRQVEVLVVEYASGDRLYLPVTRLNQVEKLSGKEGKAPKLDRLGGQSFARTKARVRQAVKILADELLALYAARAARERPPYPARDHLYADFEAHFPYEETADQARAIDEVMDDLDAIRPMDRLVCGDVGFGKTEVALRASFRAAMAGRQVAVLCPTTVLAQQHFHTFGERLAEYPLRVRMLSRFVPRERQREIVAELKDGRCDILVGTHRILSKDVHFAQLGLLVVDEEQRFGVAHKERIKKLRTEVDVLTLSATPIPRTLHMAIGGLRELSLIATPPADRRAVRTFVTRWDEQVLREAIERELSRGGQVFFIHNRIEGLYDRASRLQELVPEARIAVAHGKLKEAALERIMGDFVDGEYDILASTAIIENGLDIPRANTILIDRADIFGLSQLYQLRGRVGRSRERAYCYLIAPPPSVMSDEARTRIETLERFSQLGAGFQVASFDMELRGAGDLLGENQSGNLAAVGFDLFVHMLEEAIAETRGEQLVHEVDPELSLDVEHFIPDDYVDDVGLRLSFYKRLASAPDGDGVQALATEMEERFGPPPQPALTLIAAMALKPDLRRLRILGCEASATRVTLHFRGDTELSPDKLARLIAGRRGVKLSPDMRLSLLFERDEDTSGIDRARETLDSLLALL